MKRMIIILGLFLVAVCGVVEGADDTELVIVGRYQCMAENEEEGLLCADLKAAFERTGHIDFDKWDADGNYILIKVLPTVQDDYASITIATSLLAPPMGGFALSVTISGYLVIPGGLVVDNYDVMAANVIGAVKKWLAFAGIDAWQPVKKKVQVLETS